MNNTKELLEDFLTYLADEGVEFNLGYHDHAADYIKKKELKSDLLNPVSKRLSIKLEDWHHQCGDGCCDMYGTEIALNGKKCDNQCAGDDVRAALEFVLTELGYEVDVDVY